MPRVALPKPGQLGSRLDRRRLTKHLLPSIDTDKSKAIKIGDYIIWQYGIEDLEDRLGKVTATLDKGVRLCCDYGEYHVLWERISHIYAERGTTAHHVSCAPNKDSLDKFNTCLDFIKKLALEKGKGKFDIVDSSNNEDGCLRRVCVKYGDCHFFLSIENKKKFGLICESNFTKTNNVKVKENGEVNLAPILARLRYLKRLERQDRKKKK